MLKEIIQTAQCKAVTIKEATYLKNPDRYITKAKTQRVSIRKDDGTIVPLEVYRTLPIYVKERYYVANPAKYDAIFRTKVYIVCKNGIKYLLEDYKTLQTALKENPILPDSGYVHYIVNIGKIRHHHVTYEDECNCNNANALMLLCWWDRHLLVRQGDYVVLKSHPNCYVTSEGIFDSDTCQLIPIFVALMKYASLNKLEAYYVCTEFLKQATPDNIKAIIRYTAKHFGFGYMPPVPQDALNYVLEDNILGIKKGGYTTLFSILKSKFHIANEVIWELMNRNLVIVDSKYNIGFVSYDAYGNVTSVYKMSRYGHSDTRWCFNHYVTKPNVSFTYCSEEAQRNNTFNSLTVFDSPIELLSYLTLEFKSNPLVTSLIDGGCYMAIFNNNTVAVKEWLDGHDEVNTLNIATRFMPVNRYVKGHLYKVADYMQVPKVQELNQLVTAYANSAIIKEYCDSFRLEGWNALIELHLDMLTARFVPIPPPIIKNYQTRA